MSGSDTVFADEMKLLFLFVEKIILLPGCTCVYSKEFFGL